MKTLRSPLKAYCWTNGGEDETLTDANNQELYLKTKRSGRIIILTEIPLPCFRLRGIRVPFKQIYPTHLYHFQPHSDAHKIPPTCGHPLSHAPTHAWNTPDA